MAEVFVWIVFARIDRYDEKEESLSHKLAVKNYFRSINVLRQRSNLKY
jgi:hypothetical protein